MEKTCPSFKTCTNLLAENETLFLGVRKKKFKKYLISEIQKTSQTLNFLDY